MSLQAVSGSSVYDLISSVGAQKKNSASTSSVNTSTQTTASSIVSLSDAARALAARSSSTQTAATQQTATQSVMEKNQWLSDAAHEDAATAKIIAEDYAGFTDFIPYDAASVNAVDPNQWRLATTKELVSDADRAYVDQLKSTASSMRAKVYAQETAKGTDPAKIVDLLLQSDNSLPERYKHLTGLC